ncbi:low molecular weight protein arginine phosphatase [Halanaerocella petrolearia]
MTKILFVCTGNTCRSSMAEALCRKILEKSGKDDYQVLSAGISAREGGTAARQAIEVLKQQGLDLTDHTTTPLTEDLVKESDLILTMTRRHKVSILDNYPQVRGQVYTLKEYSTKLERDIEEEARIEELYNKMEEKRNEFLSQYQNELEELEQKRSKLTSELEEIENEIVRLENELARKLSPEKRELARLQGGQNDLDISDPFGQPVEVYQECAQEIKEELEKVVENLD